MQVGAASMDAVLVEIGAVARQLGVSPSTLRSWERRYRVVVPLRGEHGQRLYDAEQIVLLRRVATQIRRGVRARTAHDAAAVPTAFRILRVRLARSPEAPLLARRAVDDALGEYDDTRFAFSLRLVASELVTNAVRYDSGRDAIRLELKLFRDAAELQVQNSGSRLRMRSLRSRRSEHGRGLEIVDALAESWSIETGPRGTTITVRLPVKRSPARRPDSDSGGA